MHIQYRQTPLYRTAVKCIHKSSIFTFLPALFLRSIHRVFSLCFLLTDHTIYLADTTNQMQYVYVAF